MNFATRIKLLRKTSGLTQQQLAEILTIDRTTVTKWESNENIASQDLLDTICNHFDVSMDYLLGRDEHVKKEPTDESVDPSFEKLKTRLIDSGLADELENLDDEKFESFLNIMQSLIKNIK